MSVYTEVRAADLNAYLSDYQAGELLDYQGIRDGIENTNYFVATTKGEYVLTLFEHLRGSDLHFSLALLARLAEQGLPCARPLHNRQGLYLQLLNTKPASLVTHLAGQSPEHVRPAHCRAVGRTLAELHRVGQSFRQVPANRRGHVWRTRMAEKLLPDLSPEEQALLRDELACQQQPLTALPEGVIHADLFRDNVLFEGDSLTGLLDLYDAGYDLLLYDLAITATDWCCAHGQFDPPRLRALLQGYIARRPVSVEEKQAWPLLLRRAALRFWLSRLDGWYHPRQGQLTQQKDPLVYRRLLVNFRHSPPRWLI